MKCDALRRIFELHPKSEIREEEQADRKLIEIVEGM